MIGLDTNVLVRYLVQDDPSQARRATDFIERQLTAEDPGFISLVVTVETVWVLERAYGFSSREISAALERVLQVDVLTVEREEEVFRAMTALKEDRAGFPDALIAELGAAAGCERTVTLDRKAARLTEFELL